MSIFGKLIAFILSNKLKITLTLFLYLFFIFILFPFSDLGGLITSQIARLTQNQVFVKFDTLDLNILPAPGFEATQVRVQGVGFPMTTVDYLSASPSLLGLISFNPGVSIKTEGFFGGNLDLVTKTSGSTAAGVKRQNIRLSGDGILLRNLSETLTLPMNLEGALGLSSSVTLDPSMIEQPNADIDLLIKDFSMTSAIVMTPIGPLNLPDTKVKIVEIKGAMLRGDFSIEKAVIGNAQDELFAQVKGSMNLNFQSGAAGQLAVVPGIFDLVIQIKAKPQYVNKAGLFLSFIDQYKRKESPTEGNEYLFRISGQNFFAPPRISPISNF